MKHQGTVNLLFVHMVIAHAAVASSQSLLSEPPPLVFTQKVTLCPT